jgi:hypothetical protein
MLTLFGVDARDYKRFLNFLTTHDCGVDFRLFRAGARRHAETLPAVSVLPPIAPLSPESDPHLH